MSDTDRMDHEDDDLDVDRDEAKATAAAANLVDSDAEDDDAAMESGGVQSDDDDEDDDDDDGGDDLDDDEDIKLIKQYMELLLRIEANKYSYDDYVQLVNTAHELSDLDKIRQSGELFAAVYPLAPEIWLRWLRIELNIAHTDAEFERVQQLCRRALSDYYSTDVALEYANLARRSPANRSHATWQLLTFTYALHCRDGRRLFAAWRQHCLDEATADADARAQRIARIYSAELAVPLEGMEQTYVELKVLCERPGGERYPIDWARVDAAYATAKAQLARCLPFEERLRALQAHEHQQRAACYAEYIAAASSGGGGGAAAPLSDRIVQVLHERACTDCCLNAGTWLRYIEFVQKRTANASGRERQLSDAERQSPVFAQTDWDVCGRALRNCTWSAELYVAQLAIAERMEMSRDEVKAIAEQALEAAGAQPPAVLAIWLAYLAYLRRTGDEASAVHTEQLRRTCELAWDMMGGRAFGAAGADGQAEVLQLWARLEYGRWADAARGKELWQTVMQSGENRYRAGKWMEWAALEERWKGVDGARKIYRKAVAVHDMDDVECVASAWIRFERCNGTLDQLRFAERECQKHLQKAVQHSTSSAAANGSKSKTTAANGNASKDAAAGAGGKRDLKRKAPANKHDSAAAEKPTNRRPSTAAPPAKRDRPERPAAKAERPAKAAAHDADDATDDRRPPHDPASDAVTIFLSNLAYSTTEADIAAAFPELHVEHVHIVTSANGNSRGFAYARLASAAEVALALAQLDRRPIRGRPAFVSGVLRDREQRPKVFKYATGGVEPTKLFVKGLSFESTREELKAAFGACGALKDVRLVLQKNGRPKGLAYVEYETEKAASEAVMRFDQTELRGFKITVSLSAPPPKPLTGAAVLAAPSLGTGRRAKTQTPGDIKPRMSFIPRAVVQKLAAATTSSTTAPTSQQQRNAATTAADDTAAVDSSATSAADRSDTVPKSNADFRRFLLQPQQPK